MLLYHYSNSDIIGPLKVSYFNNNDYTAEGAKASNKKRLYFYTEKKPFEYRFKSCKYCYTVSIPESKIYNIDIDILNYKEKKVTISNIFEDIINKGYKGILFSIGAYSIVNIFEDIESITKERIKL